MLTSVADARLLPGRQPHIRLADIGTSGNQLGGSLAVSGVMHLVLHRGEEFLS